MTTTRKTNQEATPRINFTPKSGEIKTSKGNTYEVNLLFALTNFSEELPKDVEPHEVEEYLADFRNILMETEFPDMSLKTYQLHMKVLVLCEHFFSNLISKQSEEEA